MYIVTIKTHMGDRQYRVSTEAEALRRMRQWSKHPTFIAAKAQAVMTVTCMRTVQTMERSIRQ